MCCLTFNQQILIDLRIPLNIMSNEAYISIKEVTSVLVLSTYCIIIAQLKGSRHNSPFLPYCLI